MRQKIARITDILRRDDGISGAMHYTEQISWILFLKFIDDFETFMGFHKSYLNGMLPDNVGFFSYGSEV